MDNESLKSMEKMCETLYSGMGNQNLIDKLESQRQLLRLQSSAQFLPQLQYALEYSQNQYALFFSSKAILLACTKDWLNVTSKIRMDLQRFLIQKLYAAGNNVDPSNFVTKSLILTLCRITKLGWCSDPDLRMMMDDIIRYMSNGPNQAVLSLRILQELISEFELGRIEHSGRLDQEGRIVAQAFRDQDGLMRIFLLALETVKVSSNPQNKNIPMGNRAVLRSGLETLLACLSYDFVGTGYTESDDVVACLYIPIEWTKHVTNAGALRELFSIYISQWQVNNESEIDSSPGSAASLALQCIALVSSSRRSVFDENSRNEFLVALLEGTTTLMKEKTGLSHSEACLHHLCRILSRIKSHFQLVELAKPAQYHTWLETLAKFTEEVMSAWRSISMRTVHYLVRLWCALVLPTPYLRMRDGLSRNHDNNNNGDQRPATAQPSYIRGLENYVPRVVQAFISTRADMCSAAALEDLGMVPEKIKMLGYGSFGNGNGGIEDSPLDDEGMLLEQLTPLSMLTRYRYGASAQGLADLFMKALQSRTNAVTALISGNNTDMAKVELADSQARLAFLTYVIGAIIGGHITRVFARVIERLEEINAQLAALVFKMVSESQNIENHIQSIGQSPSTLIFGFGSEAGWRLELSTLYFFRCFQGLYIESRAREDEAEKQGRNRQIEFFEDSSGFITFSFLRRGGVSNAVGNNNIAMSDDNSKAGGANTSSSSTNTSSANNNNISTLIPFNPANRNGSIPSASVSLSNPTTFKSTISSTMNSIDNVEKLRNQSDPSKGPTPCPSPIVVDELSAAEIAKREKLLNDDANEKAAALQKSIAHIVGVKGGDRALLDIAMRRVFGLLEYAEYAENSSKGNDEGSSAPVILVQRALSVLYQLSVGVTIVHAGGTNKPRLVSSGRLLLESAVIQELLNNPSAERFPLLRHPKHGRARSFLMGTLSKLLFTQIRSPQSSMMDSYPPSRSDMLQKQNDLLDQTNLMTPLDRQDEQFVGFMKPMTEVTDGLLTVARTNINQLATTEFRNIFIGLFRDLRGVLSSATAAREYELMFSWFFPNRISLLSIAITIWNNDYQVMTPLLKLLQELVHNRGSRIVFPELSAGGLILFREASKILVAYCTPQLLKVQQALQTERGQQEKREKIKEKLSNLTNNIGTSLQEALGDSKSAPSGSSSGINSMAEDPLSMRALQEAVVAMGEEFFNNSSEKKSSNDNNSNKSDKERLFGTTVDVGQNAVGPGITYDQDSAQQKCSRIALTILSRMFSGRYALMGTFTLFGDSCMLDARRVVLELALTGSPKHIMSFQKMARALVSLLSLLADRFVLCLIDLPSPVFTRIMACLGEALISNESSISTMGARTIEAIAVYRCKAAAAVNIASDNTKEDPLQAIRLVLNPQHRSRGDTTSFEDYKKASQLFAQHEREYPNLFPSLLVLIMNILFSNSVVEQGPSQWSTAKPLMPLIFCAPSKFEEQRQQFLNAQSSQREPRVREAYDQLFSKLVPAINRPSLFNVLLRSNDLFSKQICSFCHDLRRQ